MADWQGFFQKYENNIKEERDEKDLSEFGWFIDLLKKTRDEINKIGQSIFSKESHWKKEKLRHMVNIKFRSLSEEKRARLVDVLIEQELIPEVVRKVMNKFNGRLRNVI